MKLFYLAADAEFDDDNHRYWLSRRLGYGERSVAFVGLNPSTADATHDDPTVRKCITFSKRWGFDWFYMLNLNAYRSTDPKALRRLSAPEAIGPNNVETIRRIARRCELVVAAWGNNWMTDEAKFIGRCVLALPHCRVLGFNNDGSPKHPLYLPYSTELKATGE
jgi:hypothetical protein